MTALLDGLASDRSVPAGGSATAAAIAIATALLEKVARLSTSQWASAQVALEQAHALRLRAEELVEADANAYLSFVEAMRAAKELTGAARESSVKPAREATVDVPLAIVRLGAETVALARELAANGNPNLRADAMVAATLADAAATAGARLIAVNLSGARDDQRLADARRIAKETSAAADSLATRQGS
ncbi:MAG: cyclodeaminase/cyclohydrolase family protein [Candidatus Dormibacteraeota bacterium]|nr:cyclodeaminase/cyclohydrolase family protein [Candidatus Dormibacteraeota bacterium]